MDPNATLSFIDGFLKAREEGQQVDLWCQDLFDWLSKGGFDPNWEKYPLAEGYYRCREVYHLRGERV